ncbi:PaaI family thioesterase [Actinomadura logoneensis]|uniref:Acyl-coenzyme A thioesterase THEM4 n=1 Tax=Actinomadura logoneensis TaxID=2293572 RepID=A0A372JTN0_9ACTN|nr:PaaI family thioesterase [Actinomadura logoneensis]RFU43382.1 PaaI family thioesterase [Actinomadura logoneensis]
MTSSPSAASSPGRPGPASPRTTPPPGAATPELAEGGAVVALASLAGFEGCFGCGTDAENGLRIRHGGVVDGVMTCEFTVRKEHQGAPGFCHGGVLATAMDEALGGAAWLLGNRYVTGRLETDYLAPVPVGADVHLRAWCTGVDGRKAFVEGEARTGGPDGPVAVRAAGVFIEVPQEHFVPQGS